jgi:hypothetical protein
MDADRKAFVNVRHALERSIDELTHYRAPSGITAHLRLALQRLEAHIAMLDRWEGGSGWKQ